MWSFKQRKQFESDLLPLKSLINRCEKHVVTTNKHIYFLNSSEKFIRMLLKMLFLIHRTDVKLFPVSCNKHDKVSVFPVHAQTCILLLLLNPTELEVTMTPQEQTSVHILPLKDFYRRSSFTEYTKGSDFKDKYSNYTQKESNKIITWL